MAHRKPGVKTARKTDAARPVNWLLVLALVAGTAAIVYAWRTYSSADKSLPLQAAVAPGEASPATTGFVQTVATVAPMPGPAPAGMVWIPGGEFSMGSHIESESMCAVPGVTRDALPVHRVHVDGFWMDATELTNEDFARFVKATGYVTIAEKTPTAEEFPEAPPENLVAGSTVFTPTPAPVVLNDHFQWWRYQRGANWRQPEGPGSSIANRGKYPVGPDRVCRRGRRTRNGPASACRPRRNGSLLRAAG